METKIFFRFSIEPVPTGTATKTKGRHSDPVAGTSGQTIDPQAPKEAAMTKTTLALAAALLAGTALTSAAHAGGIRLGFGFPLGSFIAHSNQNYSSAPSYSARKHCDKPERVARHVERNEAQVHKVSRPKHKVEVAEEAPAPRKIKRAPKVEVAEAAPAPRKIKRVPKVEVAEKAPAPRVVKLDPKPIRTAKLEDNTIKNDAGPDAARGVYGPEAPAPVAADVKGTQSTPGNITTAAVTPITTTAKAAPTPAVKDDVKVEAPKIEKVEKIVKVEKDEPRVKISSEAKRLCRRFSAIIGNLIDVPCE
jgi:hypothetical protein